VDINASVNLDSLWPYLTDIQASYTWDSSVVSYTTYLIPSGWSLSSLTGFISLCVTDNEDNHWAVKTLGVLSGVAASPLPLSLLSEGFYLYPNPAEDELFIRNSGEASAAITMYDAIGRIMGTGNADAESTATLDTHTLASGVYFVRIVCGGVGSSKVFVKE
jgi:hypothetical protein